MPTPASESADAFCSPVPAYSVCDAASYVSAPIALVANPPDRYCQWGVVARPSFARQTPPPAAPTHMRHCAIVHDESIAMAVTRPLTVASAFVRLRSAGTVEV